MSDFNIADANRSIASAIRELANAIERRPEPKRSEPIFIFLPSDIDPSRVKEFGQMLSRAFRGK
jgi:hypothetical protein